MSYLYLTADQIGTETGGGAVTFHESEALCSLENCCAVVDRQKLCFIPSASGEPWTWDERAHDFCFASSTFKLAHCYSGTLSKTVEFLRWRGTKVVYTIAAHRVADSRRAFESLGLPYNFPHLTDPEQWRRYSAGYFAADAIVCPSTHSRDVVQEQARELGVPCPPVTVIPHGCRFPTEAKPLPTAGPFRVGYCGAYGPDKGVRYLLEAWKKLNYRDAVLVLAGQDSIGAWARQLVNTYGGGNIQLAGWQWSMQEFYSGLHLYVQPSATEGFGLEVLEALANGRHVVCSDHAGAKDLVPEERQFVACNVDDLADKIAAARRLDTINYAGREVAAKHTWDKIRQRYVDLWRSML